MRCRIGLAVLIVAGLLTPWPLLACLWDEDTLAAEAKGIPEVVRIITGRFERNPPRYYEMRIDLAEGRITANPDDLDAYDNAGVACDRLGRGDEAIAWMERKGERLEALSGSETMDAQKLADHRYRRLANLGTFRVHRWLRDGADRDRIAEVEAARDAIAEAIRLNPDAHFGREKYQLQALEWIIQPPEPLEYGPIPTFIDLNNPATRTDEAVKGLSGLIVLGDAWQSVDAFTALARVLDGAGDRTSVAFLARLRAEELIDAGRKSLHPDNPTDPKELKVWVDAREPKSSPWKLGNEGALRQVFQSLRQEADAWHAARTAFMTSRLDAGRHPDTDPKFWNGYVEPPAPPIPALPGSPAPVTAGIAVFPILALIGSLAVGAQILLFVLWWRWWWRRPARKPAPVSEL